MAGEIQYFPGSSPDYDSETFEAFALEPGEDKQWEYTVQEAEELPAVVGLLSYLEDIGDRYTLGHSRRVAGLNAAIAMRMQQPEDTVRQAAVAGLVHDIGKRFFQHIIHIPGKLTTEQFEEIKLHAPYGAQMVAAAGLGRTLVHSTGNHHGYQARPYHTYPEALYDPQIVGPLSPDHIISTGLAVADVFDSMRSSRPERSCPRSLNEALEATGQLQVPGDIKLVFRNLFAGAVELADAA